MSLAFLSREKYKNQILIFDFIFYKNIKIFMEYYIYHSFKNITYQRKF